MQELKFIAKTTLAVIILSGAWAFAGVLGIALALMAVWYTLFG